MLGFELEGEKKEKRKKKNTHTHTHTWSRSDSGWRLETVEADVRGIREL